MRVDLVPWERAQAELLLRSVRVHGSLSAAARYLGLPLRSAQAYWSRWDLGEDCPLGPRGVLPRAPAKCADSA